MSFPSWGVPKYRPRADGEIGSSYWTTFFPAMVVLGLGMALSIAPLTATVMNAVEAPHGGVASGVNNAVSRTAGLLAVAVMAGLVLRVFTSKTDRRLPDLKLAPEVVAALAAERMKLAGAEIPAGVSPSDRIGIERVLTEAFVSGFRRVARLTTALALASSATAALMIDGDTRRS
jgi:hypothetical protein